MSLSGHSGNPARAGVRAFRRGLRGELQQLLMIALCIAVASSATVALFSDRVSRALEQQSGEAIGADRLLRSRTPIEDDWINQAQQLGLETGFTTQLASTVRGPDGFTLVGVKAVSGNYPLRGRISVEPSQPLAPGGAWVDPRILSELGIGIGDPVEVGFKTLRVTGVIHYEPDRGSGFLSLAPRLMMRHDELDETGLVAPGSRVRFHLLIAGQEPALQQFEQWVVPRLPQGARFLKPRDARQELQQALDRSGHFLALVSMASILISGVGIAICAHQLARRRRDDVALMKTLGCTRAFLLRSTLTELSLIGVTATAAGLLMGAAGQAILERLLRGSFDIELPAAAASGLLPAAATGLLMLFGFALPPILNAREAPPARIFQQAVDRLPPPWLLWYAGYVAVIATILVLHTGDLSATLIVLGGSAGCIAALALIAALLVQALGALRGRVGVAWRYGLANIARRRRQSIIQAVAFGAGLMAILLLAVVRVELLEKWRDSVPENAPNHFLINVRSEQVDAVRELLADYGIEASLSPMVRARLVAINDRPVTAADFEGDDSAQRLLRRELNLSWVETLADDNRFIDGEWFTSGDYGKPLLSIEDFIQERLGVGVGDRMTFDIAGEPLELTITSVRVINWDSMRANFFLLAPPGVLERFEATWISGLYVPVGRRDALRALLDAYPNISAINIEVLLEQARRLTDRMAAAIEYLLLFAVAAGLVVLLAGVQSTRAERQREIALLRTLGAERHVVAKGLIAEFLALGLVAGLLAAASAQLVAWAFASRVLEAPFEFSFATWATGALAGVLGIGAAGLAGTWRSLDTPPAQAFR